MSFAPLSRVRLATGILITGLLVARTVEGQEAILTSDFESGTLCQWSSLSGTLPCSASTILNLRAVAETPEERAAALTAQAELSLSLAGIAPELALGLAQAGQLFTQFPNLESEGFLSLEQAHAIAVSRLESPPTLSSVLPLLSADLAAAYADPGTADQSLLLIFETGATVTSPLPISSTSRVSFVGALAYAEWLLDSEAITLSVPSIDNEECIAQVSSALAKATTQLIVRDFLALVAHLINAALNATAECAADLFFGVGLVKDALVDCGQEALIDWIDVESQGHCLDPIGPPSWIPTATSCIAAVIPCVGDYVSAFVSAFQAAQTTVNFVNGICGLNQNYSLLGTQCNQECPGGSEKVLSVPSCLTKWYSLCSNPVSTSPTVSCAPSSSVVDDFADGMTPEWDLKGGVWTESGGTLNTTGTSVGTHSPAIRKEGSAWTDYVAEVDVNIALSSCAKSINLYTRYTSQVNSCNCQLNACGTTRTLYLSCPSETKSVPFPFVTNSWYRLRSAVQGSAAYCEVDGHPETLLSIPNAGVGATGTIALESVHGPGKFDNLEVLGP